MKQKPLKRINCSNLISAIYLAKRFAGYVTHINYFPTESRACLSVFQFNLGRALLSNTIERMLNAQEKPKQKTIKEAAKNEPIPHRASTVRDS